MFNFLKDPNSTCHDTANFHMYIYTNSGIKGAHIAQIENHNWQLVCVLSMEIQGTRISGGNERLHPKHHMHNYPPTHTPHHAPKAEPSRKLAGSYR